MAVKGSISLAVVFFFTATVLLAQTRVTPKTVRWTSVPGVKTYRLQIANDEQFQDVLSDRLVDGSEYVVEDLTPGRYYWRIAPLDGSDTVQFLKPTAFEIKISLLAAPTPLSFDKTRTRLALPGWSVATGDIVRLMSVQLRSGSSPDFIGVTAEGNVYALDGSRGITLWLARFNSASAGQDRVRTHYNQFVPLVIRSGSTGKLVTTFDRGLRALDGSTGRELWNTQIAGVPSAASVIRNEIYVVAEKSDKILILDSSTGQLRRQIELKDEAVGPPILIEAGNQQTLLTPLKGALIELRGLDGSYQRSFRMGAELTTQPIVVPTTRGPVLLMGLKNGLIALDAVTLDGLGRVAIEGNDYPIGSLVAQDLNGDKLPEVIMTTNAGRVISVDVADGKIRWSTNVGAVSVPAFADLDADAQLDIVLPGKDNFAVGLSGLTGAVIWKSDDSMATNTSGANARSVAVAKINDGRLMVVGNDRAVAGLRACEVQPMKSNP
jgi:outer membrane protein assembly factor BamB